MPPNTRVVGLLVRRLIGSGVNLTRKSRVVKVGLSFVDRTFVNIGSPVLFARQRQSVLAQPAKLIPALPRDQADNTTLCIAVFRVHPTHNHLHFLKRGFVDAHEVRRRKAVVIDQFNPIYLYKCLV